MALHDVSVDHDAISSQFNEYAAGCESVQQLEQGSVEQESTWVPLAKMLAGMLANGVTPNWDVPGETQMEWSGAVAGCLEDLFPGGLGNIENWGPWAKLAFATGNWVMCGLDYETMTIKPLRHDIDADETGQIDTSSFNVDAAKNGTFTTGSDNND